MSLIQDFGLVTPSRKLPLLTLSILDEKKIREMDILHLNKIIRYFQYLTDIETVEFSNYNLGAVSYELEENVEILEEYGFIKAVNGKKYGLTDLGEAAVEELKSEISGEQFKKLIYSKQLLNDLSFNELLFFMYKVLPETIEHSTQYHILKKSKEKIINNLLKKGKISESTAKNWLQNK